MVKKRPSMSDSLEFPTKTRRVLETLGVTPTRPSLASVEENEKHSVGLKQIVLPKSQPRRFFAKPAMDSLVASIKEHGIVQPLLVRPIEGGQYELVAGERRFRAAKLAKLSEVPVHVKVLDDRTAFQVALLENLQREDLNPVEETDGILKLLSSRLEKSRDEVISLFNHVANLQKQGDGITDNVVRSQWEEVTRLFDVIGRFTPESFRTHRIPLLSLPVDVLCALEEGKIEYTKARALSTIKDEQNREDLLSKTLKQNLSVRELKRQVKELKPVPATTATGLPQG